jgi:hypothetical protein
MAAPSGLSLRHLAVEAVISTATGCLATVLSLPPLLPFSFLCITSSTNDENQK